MKTNNSKENTKQRRKKKRRGIHLQFSVFFFWDVFSFSETNWDVFFFWTNERSNLVLCLYPTRLNGQIEIVSLNDVKEEEDE